MAKMKVHELAKELDIKSKDIIDFLAEKGIEAKAAQSSIEDDAVELVNQHAPDNAGADVAEHLPECRTVGVFA